MPGEREQANGFDKKKVAYTCMRVSVRWVIMRSLSYNEILATQCEALFRVGMNWDAGSIEC